MDWLKALIVEKLLGKINGPMIRKAFKVALFAAVTAFIAQLGWKWVPLAAVSNVIEQLLPEPTSTPNPTPTVQP